MDDEFGVQDPRLAAVEQSAHKENGKVSAQRREAQNTGRNGAGSGVWCGFHGVVLSGNEIYVCMEIQI